MAYLVLDVETTINESYGRKGNPFDPDNWVVYVGHKFHKEDSVATRYLKPEDNKGWLAKLLARNPRVIGTFNGKFDILHAIANDEVNRVAYMVWVANGGLVWDCQLAEYLLGGMLPELHMLSLDEVAPRYGGTLKVDEVKALWEAGVDTPDIPEDLLVGYLHDDIANTEKIMLGQLKAARERNQMKSLQLNMGSLLYTIEAERNGMFVDQPLAKVLTAELDAELAELDAKLEGYLPEDLPFDFNWGNRYHLSPLIFGGEVKYSQRQYDLKDGRTTWFSPEERPAARHLFAYAQKKETHFILSDGSTMSPEDWDEHAGQLAESAGLSVEVYKSGKNKGLPKTKQVSVDDYTKPKSRMADRLYKFPGFTEPLPEWASSTEGLYSVAAEVIERLGNRDIPFLKDLSRRAAVHKDLSTYFIKYDEKKGQYSGMLTHVQSDSIIHHSILHCSTVTGRFSSRNPNLQNIPKGRKSKVKQVFRSRFSGGYIIQSDFTSLEIYIQAILTGDEQLLEDLRQGLDMHCLRVSATFHVPYEQVVLSVKAEEAEDFPGERIWSFRRERAKIFSFQRAYGAGAALIAETTGMTREEVDALIKAEEARYPDIEKFYTKLMQALEAGKRGVRKVVPHPDFPAKQVELRTGYYRTPDFALYGYMENPAPKFVVEREGRWTGFSPTEVKNYVVQGTGATWMKAAMWLHVRYLYSVKNFGERALIVNTVHDAGYCDAHPDVALEAAAIQDAALRCATDLVEQHFGWELPIHIPCDTKWGPSMAVENPIKGLEELSQQYQDDIKRLFIGEAA